MTSELSDKVKDKNENNTIKVESKDLVGLTIKVNYAKTSVFFDDVNKIYIGLQNKSEDNIFKIEKEYEDISTIVNALQKNLIFLFNDKNKDVSEKYGGKAFKKEQKSEKSIFNLKVKEYDENDKNDIALLEMLYDNNHDKLTTAILAQTDIKVLERLEELECMGKNPTLRGRALIIDAIQDRIKVLKRK